MNFEQMIGSFQEPATKTASVNSANASTRLQDAVNAVVEKTASEEPVNAQDTDAVYLLEKMASELAGTEKDGELQHAMACGRAFSDGAINQWEAYRTGLQKAASDAAVQEAVKTAAVNGYNDALSALGQSMPKTAGYAPQYEEPQQDVGDMLKEAAMSGDPDAAMKLAEYNEGVQAALVDLQQGELKTAAAIDYEAGQMQALEDAHQRAAAEFLKGAAEAEILVRAMQE